MTLKTKTKASHRRRTQGVKLLSTVWSEPRRHEVSRTVQPDGGRNALAGFLYQIIGVLGLKASASYYTPNQGEDDLDALVSIVKDACVHHERFGQDAVLSNVLENGEGLSLVQFKFSRQSPLRRITPSEFEQIIDKLAESAKEAESKGYSVTGFYLITNRSCPPQRRRAAGDPSPGSTTPKGARSSKGKGKSKLRSPQERVRGQLKTLTDVPQSFWSERLRRYAADFGCHESEIEEGIDRLIGSVQRHTVERGPVVIEIEQLTKAFTEFTGARQLTYSKQKDVCSNNISEFLSHVEPPGQAIRRDFLNDLDEMIMRAALIILEGHGGNGKSTGLAKWARMTLDAPRPKPGALVLVESASQIRPDWIRELLCDCAAIPVGGHVRRSESSRTAIERLIRANPETEPPVLLLGLDGVDEGSEFLDRRHAIQETLRWFWREDEQARREDRPPIATLVVTCRDSQEIIDNWLSPDISGFPSNTRRPETIIVGNFSHMELLAAVNQSAPHLDDLFRATLIDSEGFSLTLDRYDDPSSVMESVEVSDPLIGADTVEMLRHPAVWRALLELPEGSQWLALAGERTAVRSLAQEFTLWFCKKARTRKFSNRSVDELRDVLIAISMKSNGAWASDYLSGWYEPAKDSGIVGPHEILALYREAVTAGYILTDSHNSWRWHHQMCPEFLSSLSIHKQG
jgi:hypothetical protein